MKKHVHEKQTRGKLPILIRYRAQDYQTRYLDDPRVLYIEEFHDLHRDDGFVAMIPPEKAAKKNPGVKWMALGWAALALGWVTLALAALGLIAYQHFSIR